MPYGELLDAVPWVDARSDRKDIEYGHFLFAAPPYR